MSNWSANVILVDADFLDQTVLGMSQFFKQVIDREIPPADLCNWLDFISLDGGLRQGKQEVQAIFIHSKELEAFQHMVPAKFDEELNGKAFKDYVGEFLLQSFPVERVVSQSEFFVESLEAALISTDAKRIMVIADMESYGDKVLEKIKAAEGKDVTVFSMSALPEDQGFKPEILGFSVIAALGISESELN